MSSFVAAGLGRGGGTNGSSSGPTSVRVSGSSRSARSGSGAAIAGSRTAMAAAAEASEAEGAPWSGQAPGRRSGRGAGCGGRGTRAARGTIGGRRAGVASGRASRCRAPGPGRSIGTATAVDGTAGRPDSTRVRSRRAIPAGLRAPTGPARNGRRRHRRTTRRPRATRASGRPRRPPPTAARVELRRGFTEFGAIVTRTSRRGAGRDRTASTMAAPTAAPRTMPRARKAISDGLTYLLGGRDVGHAVAVASRGSVAAPRACVNTIRRSRPGVGGAARAVHGAAPA